MSSALPEWIGLETNRLQLVPTPPVFACYTNLVLRGHFRTLIFTIARTKSAACALIQFMSATPAGFSETFNCDSRFVALTPCFIGLSSTLSNLIELVGEWIRSPWD